MHDASLGEFRRQVTYKGQWNLTFRWPSPQFPGISRLARRRLRRAVGPRVQAQEANDRTLRLRQLGHHCWRIPRSPTRTSCRWIDANTQVLGLLAGSASRCLAERLFLLVRGPWRRSRRSPNASVPAGASGHVSICPARPSAYCDTRATDSLRNGHGRPRRRTTRRRSGRAHRPPHTTASRSVPRRRAEAVAEGDVLDSPARQHGHEPAPRVAIWPRFSTLASLQSAT